MKQIANTISQTKSLTKKRKGYQLTYKVGIILRELAPHLDHLNSSSHLMSHLFLVVIDTKQTPSLKLKVDPFGPIFSNLWAVKVSFSRHRL
jgi:hypothetical protein